MWELDCEEGWVPKNWCVCTVVFEKSLESPLDCKQIQPVHSEGDQPWDFFGRNDAKAEAPVLWPPHAELTHWKRLWCWEGLGASGKGDDQGWDGWMASWTRWTWVWVNSGRWWWTGRPGVLRFMGSQRVRHDWATELNWYIYFCFSFLLFSICMACLFHLLTFSLCVSLDLKWTSCRQPLDGSCFFTHSATLCLLIEVFNLLTFKVIIEGIPQWCCF